MTENAASKVRDEARQGEQETERERGSETVMDAARVEREN